MTNKEVNCKTFGSSLKFPPINLLELILQKKNGRNIELQDCTNLKKKYFF